MNVEKLVGLVTATMPCEPIEVITAAQEFIEEINNNKIDAYENIPFPEQLSANLKELDIPPEIDTIQEVYDGQPGQGQLIPQTFSSERRMQGDYINANPLGMAYPSGNTFKSGWKECYVDRARKIFFNYNLTTEAQKVKWKDTHTLNWYENPIGSGIYHHHVGNTEIWQSDGLVLEPGQRYQLTYFLQSTYENTGHVTGIHIGGQTFTGVYTEDGKHVIDFTAFTPGGLSVSVTADWEGQLYDISLISATSKIICKVQKQGTYTLDDIHDRWLNACKYYVIARLYRRAKYYDENKASYNYALYQQELYKVKTNLITINPKRYGSDF